eukprot:1161594-Pelagomonas_calceolata.AAC.2
MLPTSHARDEARGREPGAYSHGRRSAHSCGGPPRGTSHMTAVCVCVCVCVYVCRPDGHGV